MSGQDQQKKRGWAAKAEAAKNAKATAEAEAATEVLDDDVVDEEYVLPKPMAVCSAIFQPRKPRSSGHPPSVSWAC